MPACPTTPTTPPWLVMARSNTPSRVNISHCRPTRFESTPLTERCWPPMSGGDARKRLFSTFDLDHLGFTKERDAVDQACSRSAEHHPARRGDRFHPLRHADLLADGGVTKGSRTDFAGDHLAGVQADPQLEIDAVALVNVVGERPTRPGFSRRQDRHGSRGLRALLVHRTQP